jgi:hypothetical protein
MVLKKQKGKKKDKVPTRNVHYIIIEIYFINRKEKYHMVNTHNIERRPSNKLRGPSKY